jgi:hypothetical protein
VSGELLLGLRVIDDVKFNNRIILLYLQIDTNNPIMLNVFPNFINSVNYLFFNRYE